MTKKRSSTNVPNVENAPNPRREARSRERRSERENGPPEPFRAEPDLDHPRNEHDVEDAANVLFEGPEKPGVLTRSQIGAVQNLRRKGKSIDKIHDVTGLSKSTIHRYVRNITPTGEDDSDVEYRPNPKQVTLLQTLAKQGMSNEELQS